MGKKDDKIGKRLSHAKAAAKGSATDWVGPLRRFFSDSEWQEMLHSPVHPSDRDYVQAAFEAFGRKPDNPADWVFMVIALSHVPFRRDRPGRPPKLREGPEAIAREFEDTREATLRENISAETI
jgi:hypothetical protein